MAKFEYINPVSIAYLSMTAVASCFAVLMAFVNSRVSALGEVLQYWFLPFTLEVSHAFGSKNVQPTRLIFLVVAVAGIVLYLLRGNLRDKKARLFASVTGVAAVIIWALFVVFVFFSMHIH